MKNIDLNAEDDKIYEPQANELQLTFRAVFIGMLLGGLVVMINVYFGLQTGWTMSGSLISAILAFGLFSLLPLKRRYTILENNISQTAASAASGVAGSIGTLTVLPAIKMMGIHLSIHQLFRLEDFNVWHARF